MNHSKQSTGNEISKQMFQVWYPILKLTSERLWKTKGDVEGMYNEVTIVRTQPYGEQRGFETENWLEASTSAN